MSCENKPSTVKDRLDRIRERMARAASASGRSVADILLVAVTKGVPPEKIAEAQNAGLAIFGENRVQEAAAKIPLVQTPAEWHLIGHLQTNKVKDALSLFQVVQSVDTVRLARAIHEARVLEAAPVRILLEVNVSGESRKYGFNPQDVYSAADAIGELEGLSVTGLMGMAPNAEEAPRREAFSNLRKIFGILKSLKKPNFELKHLSMGMSDDFEAAIKEGSTMVRLGRALFA